MTNAFESIHEIAHAHGAWSNSFFDRAKRGLTQAQLHLVCPDYWRFTEAFPGILSQLIARVEGGTQFHLVSILFSELGSGVEANAHGNLFRRLCRDIGLRDEEISSAPCRPETKELIEGLRHLYKNAVLPESLGAQYALEYQAQNMLASFKRAFALLDENSQNHVAGMSFFDVHDTEEPGHIAAMKFALIRCMREDADRPKVIGGARQCLNLFAKFWRGLDASISEAV